MMDKIKAVFIVGPTASGKTRISIEIAKQFNGEIVSADSMQIYKGIHIASAAPDEEEKQGIPHHLLEFLELDKDYSVADYVLKARRIIEDINSRGKLPIIVGGTGLYISSLLDNTEFIEANTDLSLRAELEKQFDEVGGEEMLNRLALFDDEASKRLHPNNRRRIIRAFEVFELTGKTITEQNLFSHEKESVLNPLVIGLGYKNRELLYEKINKRVDIMLKSGLLEEARSTLASGGINGAFQAIGHKELFGYLEGRVSLDEAAEHLKQQTRRYAKRQLTWFRRDTRINWIFADEVQDTVSEAGSMVSEFLKEA